MPTPGASAKRRQALLRLEQIGLVAAAPNRGFIVSHLRLQDAREILMVRAALEGLAAAEACLRLTPADIDVLSVLLCQSREAYDAGNTESSAELGHQFHYRIMDAANNQRLSEMISSLNDQYHRVRLISNATPDRLDKSLDEHEALFTALASGNALRSEQLMRQHLINVYHDLELNANVADDGHLHLSHLLPVTPNAT